MAQFRRSVTSEAVAGGLIPSDLGLYVVLVEWLRGQGLLEEAGALLRLELRSGKGYSGEDLFMFLLALFSSGRKCGIRRFSSETRAVGKQLAGVFGRKGWPSQAAVSRCLHSVSTREVEGFLTWLLVEAMSVLEGRRDLESWLDRNGDEWSSFHWDGRVTPVRLRGLPQSGELPEPIRRMDRVAAPGYSGRKQRADVQWNISKVFDGGSGRWTNVRVGAGNGSVADQQERAHQAVSQWAEVHHKDSGRCVVISDGAGGGYDQVTAGLASPVCFLTRSANYRILESEEAKAFLASAVWEPVEDSCSGPVREATEFGSTTHSSGAAIRLVVSRYWVPADQKESGAGHRRGEWMYEMFATDLPYESFCACDLVWLYYSRCGIESAFACENREFAADYKYCNDMDGQELCQGIADFVWNMEMALGLEMVEKMGELPPAPPPSGKPKRASPSSKSEPNAPHLAQPRPAEAKQPAQKLTLKVPLRCIDSSPDIPWNEKLRYRENWSWNSTVGTVQCPGGHLLQLKSIIDRASGEKTYRFRASGSMCKSCAPCAGCSAPRPKGYRREVDVQLTGEEAAKAPRSPKIQPPRAPARTPAIWTPPGPTPQPSVTPPRPPQLLLSEIRHFLPGLCLVAQVEIHIEPGYVAPKPSRFLALSPGVRQRRRKTWPQRRRWNALPDDAVVRIRINAPSQLAALLTPTPNAPQNRGGPDETRA